MYYDTISLMESIIISKTKDYLILRIPTKALKTRKMSGEELAVQEGLKALEKGKVSKSFKTAKEAVAFLRSL